MPTASFSVRLSILLRVNFSSRDDYSLENARWRAQLGPRLYKAGGQRASGDRWLKYNFQNF